jgi:hypothetical protein
MLFQRYTKFIPNLSRRDGIAFLGAYRSWFGGENNAAVDTTVAPREETRGGPLGACYDTFTTPQQKRGQADRLTP